MKKSIKLIFYEKMRPKSVVLHSRKKFQVLKKKKFFPKKKIYISSSLFVQIWSLKNCADFLKRYLSYRDIKVPVILNFQKIFLHNEIINKTRSQNNKKISHSVLERVTPKTILQDFWKIALKPEELELMEYVLLIPFFKENCQWGLSNLL